MDFMLLCKRSSSAVKGNRTFVLKSQTRSSNGLLATVLLHIYLSNTLLATVLIKLWYPLSINELLATVLLQRYRPLSTNELLAPLGVRIETSWSTFTVLASIV